MIDFIKDPIIHRVEVRRRLTASEQVVAEQARLHLESLYRKLGIKNPHERVKV